MRAGIAWHGRGRGPLASFSQSLASYGSCVHNTDYPGAGVVVHDVDGGQGEEGVNAMMTAMGSHLFNLAHEGPVEPWCVSCQV